jgi:hypothetical protein
MNPDTRQKALSLLSEVSELSPDVRLGQLFAHLGFLGEDATGQSLWDIDDEQMLAVLNQHRTELLGRAADTPGCVAWEPSDTPRVQQVG